MSGVATIVHACVTCGRKNRVPVANLAREGRCGACKAPLTPLAEPLDVGPREFRDIVAGAAVPVLVDFWAAWCAPCRAAAPEVKRTAQEMRGRALVLKVDTEAHAELAQAYQVRGIPHFAVLKDGAVHVQQSGLVDHRVMKHWLEQAGA
jgi:thioredoxin 2